MGFLRQVPVQGAVGATASKYQLSEIMEVAIGRDRTRISHFPGQVTTSYINCAANTSLGGYYFVLA